MILGENGSGKSTVLRAIAMVMAGSDALPELLPDPAAWVRLGRETASIEAVIETARGEERTVSLHISRSDTISTVLHNNRDALSSLDDALRHTPRNYFTVGYGVTRRLLNARQTGVVEGSGGYRQQRAQNVATMFSTDAVLNPLENWAMDLVFRRGQSGITIIRKALDQLLPDVEFSSIDRDRRSIMFKTGDGILPFSALSDGYQDVAAWCGDLLFRLTETFADYKDPLSTRGLLLIDELDLHLHPNWQRNQIRYINEKLPNFQLVVTTHSPLTAQQAGDGELFTLKRERPDEPPVCYQYPGNPSTLTVQQLLLSPVFGLSTLYSRPIELMREEYRSLEAKSASERTTGDQRRLNQLRRELEDLPDYTSVTPLQKRQEALLSKIEESL
jgi:hypothetical protein